MNDMYSSNSTPFSLPGLFDIYGEHKLSVFQKNSPMERRLLTDFAKLCGDTHGYTLSTTTIDSRGHCVKIVHLDGSYSTGVVGIRSFGYRPIIHLTDLKKYTGVIYEHHTDESENTIIFGEYPQHTVDENTGIKLEKLFSEGRLSLTGKTYAYSSSLEFDDFEIKKLDEYKDDSGKKYVRITLRYPATVVLPELFKPDFHITNPEDENEEIFWISVEPIKWLVDNRKGIAISENVLFGGVPFNDKDHENKPFLRSTIKAFIDTYFANDILVKDKNIYSPKAEKKVTKKKRAIKKDPYGFNYDDVSEEDIIRGAIEGNISVFLHGKSGDGKSARVKQIDPNCEIIYMRTAKPESLVGKTALDSNSGELIDIPPTWYTRIKEKCEAEPDRNHIVFFDELTNALPSIQSMAFNIILDHEIDGKWKLPPNCRIVAAGNEVDESLAANAMPEPLFNRFAHVYIKTTVESWLEWASTKEANIHPSIYSYIAYKASLDVDVLRTEYNGQTPNADPRKWEMASKILYSTNKPEMLRSIIGDALTKDFISFVKTKTITIEDVINKNYTQADFLMDSARRYATAVSLANVSEENFETVREFVKLLGPEERAVFETIWAKDDPKRLEMVSNAHINDQYDDSNKPHTMGGRNE